MTRLALRCVAGACALAAARGLRAGTPLPQAAHDALHAMGPQAAHIVDLWRIFLVTCTLVFVAILGVLGYALWRRPRAGADTPPDLSKLNRPEPRPRRAVAAGVALSTVLLVGLVAASVFTDRALARLALGDAVNIEVTANQWWWTVRYVDGGPANTFETANEVTIPVGRAVVVKLKASDVIHSLWIPSLAGKKDLIPGRTALMSFRADRPGVYRAQCAEFCGFQHALMGLVVNAVPPADYEVWLQAQRRPAAPPADAKARRGKAVFESVSCAMCHAIQGTQAQARRAPDLTHLASRRTLAAGTLPNTPQALASWIADPQRHKPGVNMPVTPLSADDLAALVAYLGALR